MEQQPKIGVGVVIVKGSKLLLGRRIGSHGAYSWSLPGGHLEWCETPEQCARREVKEETNLDVDEFIRLPWTNDIFQAEQQHYVTLFLQAKYAGGEPKVMEPDKCLTWQWFDWDALPETLFQPLQTFLDQVFDERFVS